MGMPARMRLLLALHHFCPAFARLTLIGLSPVTFCLAPSCRHTGFSIGTGLLCSELVTVELSSARP